MKPITFNERTIVLSDVVLSGNNYACIVKQSTIHGLRLFIKLKFILIEAHKKIKIFCAEPIKNFKAVRQAESV